MLQVWPGRLWVYKGDERRNTKHVGSDEHLRKRGRDFTRNFKRTKFANHGLQGHLRVWIARVQLFGQVEPCPFENVPFVSKVITPGGCFERSGIFRLQPRPLEKISQFKFDTFACGLEIDLASLSVQDSKLFGAGNQWQLGDKASYSLLEFSQSLVVCFAV